MLNSKGNYMKSRVIKIGDKKVGDNQPCFVVAEVGINHNGSIDDAKKLINMAHLFGCDAVKFQKRTVDIVYSKEELARPRESIFGNTNGDLKRGLEFGYKEYKEIDKYCKELGILWFASCWDNESVDFIEQFDVCAHKIPSACLTDTDLLKRIKQTNKPILLATGMSTLEEIDKAVEIIGTDNMILYHCTSTYPTANNEINLMCIKTLKERYDCLVGFSGHEKGIFPSTAAVVLGACSVERHITLDRTMWGSDQAASLESEGLRRMIRDIKSVGAIMGDGKKVVYESELPIKAKLRRKG